jgi:putative photosynthetic complex assembly protein 2
MTLLAAIIFVTVLWSASTAVIFYLDSLPTRTFKYSMAAATLVLAVCGIAIWQLRADTSTLGLASSFAAGLLAWGWTEMSLYMGYITGPRKQRCEEGCHGAKHFGHAISANLWHELLVIGFAGVVWLSGNHTALWCFVMLWLMHLSARLNVFLGVRNISAEFVPAHMDVLKSFLRRRRMNALFPLSCIALLAVIVYLVQQPESFAGNMAISLAAIGLLEHVLLMLPLPIERLWYWTLSKTAHPKSSTDDQPLQKNQILPQRTMGVLS